jgi:hypothetical protein
VVFVAVAFGEAPRPTLRERLGIALVNKGVTLGQFGRSREAVVVDDEVLARFGHAREPALRELAALVRGLKESVLTDDIDEAKGRGAINSGPEQVLCAVDV